MPVMKFHSPYEAAFLPIEVTAYMLYPADEKLRNAFLTRKMAEYTVFCASEDGLESIPIEVSKDLLETPATAGADAMESLALRGAVAGKILLNLIKLNASGEDASVNKGNPPRSQVFPGGPKLARKQDSLWTELYSTSMVSLHARSPFLGSTTNPCPVERQSCHAHHSGFVSAGAEPSNRARQTCTKAD